MIDLLLKDATIVTMDPQRTIRKEAAMAVDGGRILEVGPTGPLAERYPARRVLDLPGRIVFPGLINTHNHLFQSLFKGLGDDRVLADWLRDVTFPSAVHLEAQDCYTAALLGCSEALRSGVTTQLDYMYAHPREQLADGVLQAFSDLGIRGILARGFMDAGAEFGVQPAMMETRETIAADVRRLAGAWHGSQDGRIRVWLAPAAVWSNTRETLALARDLARELDTGVTLHISETPFDREASQRFHGAPDIDVAQEMGLLGPGFLMVHCVYLTPRDIRMARALDARISHNPVSNMYLSSGVAPVPAWNQAGIPVGLGTDGAGSNNSNDMIELLKMTALLQKVTHRDPTVITAEKVLEMATIEGARAVNLDGEIGSLEAGKRADFFVFHPARDLKAVPMHHPVSTLVYSSGNRNVEAVAVDGVFLLEEGRLLPFGEEALAARAQACADDLARRAGTAAGKDRPWRSLAY